MGTISPSRARQCGAMNYWAEFLKDKNLVVVSEHFAAFRLVGDPLLPPVPGDATLSVKARMAFPRNGGEEWFPQDFVIPMYVPQKIACSATMVMVEDVKLRVKPDQQYVIVDARYAKGMLVWTSESLDENIPDDDLKEVSGDDPYGFDADFVQEEVLDEQIVLKIPKGAKSVLIEFED